MKLKIRNIFKNKLVLGMIIVPFIISVVYLTLFATNRYVSSSQIVVRQQESGSQGAMPGIAMLIGSVDPVSREDTLYLKEYIISHDMLAILEEKLDWTAHYSGKWGDPFYDLSKDAPQEEKLKFYQKLVTTNYNETTGLLTVQVEAFAPEYAETVLKEILKQSGIFVNAITRSMADEKLAFSQRELVTATERYEEMRSKMVAFQNQYQIVSAEGAVESVSKIIASLEAAIAMERASLNGLKTRLSANAPQIKAQQNKINALVAQLEAEQRRVTSGEYDTAEVLNAVSSDYRRLQVDVMVAEELYKASLAIVENAKLETIRNIRSLIAVVKPNLPQEAAYPRVIYNLITILIVLLLLYGVTRFVIASIQDHRE